MNPRRHVSFIVAGEKFELTTNALDMVRAERDGEGNATHGMRTVWTAARRMRLGVPGKFEDFLSDLDDLTDLDGDDDEDGAGPSDPTQLTA